MRNRGPYVQVGRARTAVRRLRVGLRDDFKCKAPFKGEERGDPFARAVLRQAPLGVSCGGYKRGAFRTRSRHGLISREGLAQKSGVAVIRRTL